MAIKALRGFVDVLPQATCRWRVLESSAHQILNTFGFSEIRLPLLERAELFARSIGEETDIVEKEMYTFADRSGDLVTLRPEATASIARAYIEHKLYASDPIAKLYTIGPMFRHERPQKGRLRQFHQINAEVFGISHPSIDAELMAIVIYYLDRVGAVDYRLEVNSLGCPDCRPPYRERLLNYLKRHISSLCPDCRRRLEKNPLRAFDCKISTCQEVMASAPLVSDSLCPACTEHFSAVRGYLEILGVPYEVNKRMVRGLDYYTKTAFEVVAVGLGAQNAVAAGGRYDQLVAELGGPDVPGIGFAIGVERLLLITPETAAPSGVQIFIAPLGEEARREAIRISHQLNREGVKTMIDYEGRSLKAQLRRANKYGARYVLIIGEDELKQGTVTWRDMSLQSQQPIPFPSLLSECLKRAKGYLNSQGSS